MPELKGTETEQNLLKSFAGESQARNRYTFFTSIAKKEGYEQIAAIFHDTANNEKEHAEIFFKHLKGGDTTITAEYPSGKISTTTENLQAAANGEKLEWSTLYPQFQQTAQQEGFPQIAKSFQEIAKVEEQHEKRYLKLHENIKNGNVFKRDTKVEWRCRNCGYIHHGKQAPETCPACKHTQNYYELHAKNY